MMEKEYVKSLEDRVEELENALKLLYPTTENILRTIIDQKRNFLDNDFSKMCIINERVGLNVLREVCTIHFNIGRQTGHTTAIIKLCKEQPNDSLIIVNNRLRLERYYPKELTMHNDDICRKNMNIDKKLIFIEDALIYNTQKHYINSLYERVLAKTLPVIVIT